MPLVAPNLDDRDFDRILAEAKSLIPRYAPEWTDHNESDPGITLLQLFSWMTEMLIYRLNQVPERNYIEFLRLVGTELKPAHPATAELTFNLTKTAADTVIVPRGTQVAVSDGGDGAPLVFETEESLVALSAKLAAVQSFDGFAFTVETKKNEAAGQSFYPFGPHAREGAALYLGFDTPNQFPSDQVNLTVYVHAEGLRPEGRHCDLDLGALPVPATLAWEYWDGAFWQQFSPDKDETRAFTRDGHVYLSTPGASFKKSKTGSVVESLYWIRCRLERSSYDTAPQLDAVMTNTVRAAQAQTARDEVLGGSSGRPDQTFKLASAPVVVRARAEKVAGRGGGFVNVTSLRLEVDEGQGFEVWEERADFFDSGPDDPHYLLNRTTGEVKFGDGRRGRIPVANPANPNGNIVAREYRFGGGKRGNVGAGTITGLQTFVESVDSVTNRRAATGGADEETLTDAKLRAPREIKSKERAVTAEDFEFLARETPGARVRRAKALPLRHPQFTGAPIPGVVTVVVVPDSDSPRPTPGSATLAAVCAHLNKHRLLTSEVHVVPPTYRKVRVEADIVVRPEDDLSQVKREVEQRLTTYFHPLRGGERGEGWEFGGEIFYSDVYRTVLQTEGVARIRDNQLEIILDDERQTFCRDVPIGTGELVYSDGHDIRVSYS